VVFSNLLRWVTARCFIARLVIMSMKRTGLNDAAVRDLRHSIAGRSHQQGGRLVTEPLLRLYIAGNSAVSRRAEQNLSHLQRLIKPQGWDVEVIDVLMQPERAEQARILATPTLSYDHPMRPRRIVGDLSDTKSVLAFLGIELKRDTL